MTERRARIKVASGADGVRQRAEDLHLEARVSPSKTVTPVPRMPGLTASIFDG